MTTPTPTATAVPAEFQFRIEREVIIAAPADVVFDTILDEMGPDMATPDGTSLSMKLEAKPGGRWFRDLGGDAGHLWGHVQSIKRGALLELTGPLFMSAAVSNNIIYRLHDEAGSTRMTFVHTAFGLIPAEAHVGMPDGWTHHVNRIQTRAQERAH
jgi:uncharacterized protein YndB with AHSA1/START domain